LLIVPIITHKPTGAFDFVLISLQCLRICNLIALLCLYLVLCSRDTSDNDAEHQSLLADQITTSYGGIAAAHSAKRPERDDEEDEESGNTARHAWSWWDYAKEFQVSTYHLDVLDVSLTDPRDMQIFLLYL
jgi:hypothetical protein